MLKRLFSFLLMLSVLVGLTACRNANKHNSDETPKKLSEIILDYCEGGSYEECLVERLTIDKRIDGKDGNSWSMQGGANDGTYGYFVMNEHPDEGRARSRIYKIDLKTWEIVKISEDLDLGHGNDVTYMPKDHRLVVTLCEAPGDGAVVVDAESLEIIETITYPQQHPCMTYSPELDRYAFVEWGEEDNLAIYDGNLEKVIDIQNQYNFAEQCLACDDKLIYFLESPNGKGANEGFIFVFTWDGEYKCLIDFTTPYEVENISVYGDKFILAVNDHHEEKVVRFYELSFVQK